MRKTTKGRNVQYAQRIERDKDHKPILDVFGNNIPIGERKYAIQHNKEHVKFK